MSTRSHLRSVVVVAVIAALGMVVWCWGPPPSSDTPATPPEGSAPRIPDEVAVVPPGHQAGRASGGAGSWTGQSPPSSDGTVAAAASPASPTTPAPATPVTGGTEAPATGGTGGATGPADAAAPAGTAARDGEKAGPSGAADRNPGDYGRNTPVAADATPQTRSVAEALRTKDHPERLTPLIPPRPFDREQYLRDPKAYCDTIEPGRVFQAADPDTATARIEAVSPTLLHVKQGDEVELVVRAEPGMPVSLSSFDLGRFRESQLTSITVQADQDGVARVHFQGTPGTINEVNILASCPTTSGQIRFNVYVQPAE